MDLWPCNGGLNQQWYISEDPLGNTQIGYIGSTTGPTLCLDSSGGPPVGGGTQLVVEYCGGQPSATWIVRGMQLAAPNAPYVCANVEASRIANGTPVLAYSCDDAPNELWNYENGQIYGIGTANGVNKCLTLASFTPGNLVTLSTCTDSSSPLQYLTINRAGQISNSGAFCLDRSGGPTVGGGTQLVIDDCSSASSQNWAVR